MYAVHGTMTLSRMREILRSVETLLQLITDVVPLVVNFPDDKYRVGELVFHM